MENCQYGKATVSLIIGLELSIWKHTPSLILKFFCIEGFRHVEAKESGKSHTRMENPAFGS